MTWYEFWLFVHLTSVIVWVGGAAVSQAFGVLTKRAADPTKTAFFARSVSSTIMWVFLPSSLLVLASGIGLTEKGGWPWDQPFIRYGLVMWVVISLTGIGYVGRALGRAGAQLAAEGPSPALALRLRNLVWLSRVLLLALVSVVFEMTVKLGT